MKDLISKACVLETYAELYDIFEDNQFIRKELNKVYDKLNGLPYAKQEIIHCKDCKWKNRHNCTRAVELFIDDNKYCAWAERRTDERTD